MEIIPKQIEKDVVKATTEQQQEKQKTLIGSIRQHKGHTLWEINLIQGKVEPATFKEEKVLLDGSIKKMVVAKEGCIYVSALNKKTATKKAIKQLPKL